jgi:hypothetical protein
MHDSAESRTTTEIAPRHQCNVEIFVTDLPASIQFWQSIGFHLSRKDGDFALLKFNDESYVMLDAHTELIQIPPGGPFILRR